ncbi:hypothetical protein HII31_06640 [Pseudocercospora fuligena]|uniref:Uncharacterized protein n=1 Tax=Pseudocercospora fuligena TaxID=685502 RepID=A0A8H6VHR7_9PEZI|nr:hypothetical protein HII31_06640 [Pseudocercospora fuligena]
MSPGRGLQLPSKRSEASSGSSAPLSLRSKKRSRSATEEDDEYEGPPPPKEKKLYGRVKANFYAKLTEWLKDHTPETFLLYVDFIFDGHIRFPASSSEAHDRVMRIVCLHLLAGQSNFTEAAICGCDRTHLCPYSARNLLATPNLRQATAMVHRLQFIAEVEKASKEMVTLSGADVISGKSSDASKS